MIDNISRDNFLNRVGEDYFFTMVKSGFAHKRKVLRKNLESILNPSIIEKCFLELKIDSKVRPEDLSISTWLKLAKLAQKV